MWIILLICVFTTTYAFAAQPLCEENLKVVTVQAQEYHADRETKQREKIALRVQLNDALLQIQNLKSELIDAKKLSTPSTDETKK